jgi:hypothetical protein
MKAAALTLSVLIASVGQCQSDTGNDIRESCQITVRGPKGEGVELTEATYCLGFVTAILFVGRHLDEQSSFCAPVGVTVQQAVNVFLKYLNENPDKTHYSAESLAVASFRQAWPCK